MQLSLTREQVRRIDELAESKYHIPSLILMENAGRSTAAIIDREYGPNGKALIICGPGNNGGDGFVVARHLHNAGWRIQLYLSAPVDRLTADAKTNYQITRAMELPFANTLDVAQSGVIVDAFLGTGFAGALRQDAADLIERINTSPKRAVVAIDIPSGLDCDTGMPCPIAVRADLTVTFVAAKPGLLKPAAAPWVGRMEVADIGAPRSLIEEMFESAPPLS